LANASHSLSSWFQRVANGNIKPSRFVKLDTSAGSAILLSKGCGVTSEGYLIIEPEDVSL
jgi:hypothetical protein